MTKPVDDLAGAEVAWAALDRSLVRLTDERAREPSHLPGWTRAHVIAHIWGNGEGFAGLVAAAARGRVGAQYPGGAEQRARDIEGRSALPLDVIVEGAREANFALVDAWEQVPDDGWEQPSEMMSGMVPVRATGRARWRELLVHHVDLDVGFGPDDLPPAFVEQDRAWLVENRDWDF